MKLHRLCLFAILPACGSSCPLPDAGGIQAQIDGEHWEDANPQWSWTGTGVQVLTTTTDGWRITLVAQRNAEDDVILDLADTNGFPAEINLSGTDGFGVIYDADGQSWTLSKGGSGTLTLKGIDGDVLSACFSFDAYDSDGALVEVTSGGAVATAL